MSSKYVSELEERIAYLEGLIIEIRDTVPEARSILSETSEFSEITVPPRIQSEPSPVVISPQPDNLEPDPEGSLIYHGPTSIIHGKLRQSERVAQLPDNSTLGANTGSNFEQVAQHFGISLDNDLVTVALMHFFKWQYPQFMFIYREAFLRDHFGDRQSCKYWSSGLVLSICALGLLMSPNDIQRRASEQFFSAAETTLIVYGFARPSIATVQAFLCLAFYEIGRGNMSKGWGFSGKDYWLRTSWVLSISRYRLSNGARPRLPERSKEMGLVRYVIGDPRRHRDPKTNCLGLLYL